MNRTTAESAHECLIPVEEARHPDVLLVDDDAALLDSMFALLSIEGYRLRSANCGKDALALLMRASFDVVLLDLNLPDMSGHTVMDQARALGVETPFVIVSGETGIDAAIGSIKRGAYDFVRKPHAPAELLHTVARAVERAYLARSHKAISRSLAQSEALHRSLVEASPDLIVTLDEDGAITFVNPRAARQFGDDGKALIGQSLLERIHPDDRERLQYALVSTGQSGAVHQIEARMRHQPDEPDWRTFEFSVLAFLVDGSTPFAQGRYVIARDITDRKEIDALIAHQAFHDTLTGLPNRVLFNDRLGLALVQARRTHTTLAVMFIDLDRFKLVSDTLGHHVGDELLKEVSERMKSCLRAGDTLARVGGDEFLVLLPDVSSRLDAECVADKIVRRVSESFVLGVHELFLSASIGIALFPEHGESAQSLIGHADVAMYDIKVRGKNGFGFYEPSHHVDPLTTLSMQGEIRRALAGGEFTMFYQPQIDATNGALIGAEALIHWDHPTRGLLSAGEFVPFCEEVGLINEMTDWLLDRVFADIYGWLTKGYTVPRIGINLSPQYLEREDFVARVLETARVWRVPHSLVEFEITETVCIRNPEALGARLSELCRQGFAVTIDDFGVRYSSLAYLQSLPVSRVKIDQSFVRHLNGNQGVPRAITAILAIARGLSLEVVAEGVEHEHQRQALILAGCPNMQGYFFSRPVAREGLHAFLVQPRPKGQPAADKATSDVSGILQANDGPS